MTGAIDYKFNTLCNVIERYESMVVAFSGGVDSTFLLSAAHEKLGDRVMAVTVHSVIHQESEIERAKAFATALGVEHLVLDSDELQIPEFVRNEPDRCYHCKKASGARLSEIARAKRIAVVAHGANADDPGDYRPGHRAAEEAGIVAPLLEAGLTKEDIRALSRARNLITWDLPAMACLATRIPYGTPITAKNLAAVRDAEMALRTLGFYHARVRHHGSTARIELPPDSFEAIMNPELRSAVVEALHHIGFSHAALDLEGYVSGKMNRELLFDRNEKIGDSNK